MLSIETILEATGGSAAFAGVSGFSGISIDSRTSKEGSIFLALKGENHDGHDFVPQALKKCSGAIVNRDALCADGSISGLRIADCEFPKTLILVSDTLHALHALARFLRKRFEGPVIGVVGSNGKTTTKELTVSVLGMKMKVLKTEGNLNNHIGMPLCMTNLGPDIDSMVLEMGTNRPGDVAELCSIAAPDTAVITNIGYEHLEGFGSIEKVRESELEVLCCAKRAIVNADDGFLMDGVKARFNGEIISFGIGRKSGADVFAEDIIYTDAGAAFTLCTKGGCLPVESRLPGLFNIYNSLAAAAAGTVLGLDMADIRTGLEAFEGVSLRFKVQTIDGVVFLNDVYNANPSSMEASLTEMSRLMASRKKGRAIAVLGDMLELGGFGTEAHKEIGRKLLAMRVDMLIAVGPLMIHAAAEFGSGAVCVNSSDEGAAMLAEVAREGDIVLIKGSRGMRMEKVLENAGRGGTVNAV
ncbi:MAG: UDP-N-acetylmuramoyl-tripeptide--D-alanyl-D-alanine ligase [Nitrospirae bacterium]|nr:MAG: UDP-N-acetylmuramoyl-tripeptide--D-alanyl-D-alanine ligase [Nitrospirota bacterium]